MTCLLATSPMTGKNSLDVGVPCVSKDLLQRMESEAKSPEPLANLSSTLFTQMRKVLNQPRVIELLGAVQILASEGTPEGARLLAAFLDVNTPGARLLPHVQNFHSCRRRRLSIMVNKKWGSYEKDWLHRLDLLGARCHSIIAERNLTVDVSEERPGHETPWPMLRACLRTLLLDVATDKVLESNHRDMLVGMLKLETDSRQDRVSNLAGIVNPFNVAQISRLLPMLSAIDGEIRDLRQLVAWIAEGKDKVVFNKRLSRALEVMDGNEFSQFLKTDDRNSSIAPLLGLLRSQNDKPLALEDLGAAMTRLMGLSHCLVQSGIRESAMDPLTAATLVHRHLAGNEVWIPLEIGISSDVQLVLETFGLGAKQALLPLSGIRVVGDQLCLPVSGGHEFSSLLDGVLPSLLDIEKLMEVTPLSLDTPDSALDEGVDDSRKDVDESSTAVTHLVMQNIQSVSVLLGFLRNPKVIAIPGLVGKIAGRTRNARIIETIASDRALYSGFANRDVPLACLTSSCNVPVKTLSKFIHVKFISKVDLRRMVKDKAGMRREVISEIENYLDSLD